MPLGDPNVGGPIPQSPTVGIGQLAQPQAQGVRPPASEEELNQNRTRAGNMLNRFLTDPDAMRFMGTVGAWISAGQPAGMAIQAGLNQMADSQALRQKAERQRALDDAAAAKDEANTDYRNRALQAEIEQSNLDREAANTQHQETMANRLEAARIRSRQKDTGSKPRSMQDLAKEAEAVLGPPPLDPEAAADYERRRQNYMISNSGSAQMAIQLAQLFGRTDLLRSVGGGTGDGGNAGATKENTRASATPQPRATASSVNLSENTAAPVRTSPQAARSAEPGTGTQRAQQYAAQGQKAVATLNRLMARGARGGSSGIAARDLPEAQMAVEQLIQAVNQGAISEEQRKQYLSFIELVQRSATVGRGG